MPNSLLRTLVCAGTLGCVATGCAGNGVPPVQPDASSANARSSNAVQSPIQHIIVVVQQSRTFDNLFAGYPGANAPTSGLTSTGQHLPLKPVALGAGVTCEIPWMSGRYFDVAYDHGKMDGFNRLNPNDPLCPYTRVERSQVTPYWMLAQQYALADRFFPSTVFGNLTNSLYLIANTSASARDEATVSTGSPIEQASCTAIPGTTTIVVGPNGMNQNGPFPCYTFETMANTLDAAHVSWRYYAGGNGPLDSSWNAFGAIKHVRDGADWNTNISGSASNVLADLRDGKLAAMSWVVSDLTDSDAPSSKSANGPQWVSSLVEAVKASRYWQHTAVIVVWTDDAGGRFYDDVAPPLQGGFIHPGFRVPMLVISPYARRGYVSHTSYEFASILKFVDQTFGLPPLSSLNGSAQINSIADCFKF
jgi:phospholipase C